MKEQRDLRTETIPADALDTEDRAGAPPNGANTNHVPYACSATYKNIACGLNNRPWLDCDDIPGSSLKQCSHS